MRKKLSLFAVLLFSIITFAQVPQGISYQAIALNGSGNPVVSSNVGIRLSVLDVSATGTALYTETQTKMTTAQGLFNLVIGQGTPVSGTFAEINWKTNSKFLKVEMDVAGGTNYVLVGTTQLLSVPYALAAKSLVLAPGEGITLTSPNGTPYTVSVNNDGELSLPTSNAPATAPSSLYLYGSFNSWNAASALQFGNYGSYGFRGFKYFTAGTQIKFLGAQNTNVVYGGNGMSGSFVPNGNAITIPTTGFYRINVTNEGYYELFSINVSLDGNSISTVGMTYNSGFDYFVHTYNQPGTNFLYAFYVDTTNSPLLYGDNLQDGNCDINGIYFNVATSGSKTFKLYINFDGSAHYTIN